MSEHQARASDSQVDEPLFATSTTSPRAGEFHELDIPSSPASCGLASAWRPLSRTATCWDALCTWAAR
jgi:hypothetical protein